MFTATDEMLREASTSTVFSLARTLANLIDEQDSITPVLVTGDTLTVRETRDLTDKIVAEAVRRHNRAIASRLYLAFYSRAAVAGLLLSRDTVPFEEAYPI